MVLSEVEIPREPPARRAASTEGAPTVVNEGRRQRDAFVRRQFAIFSIAISARWHQLTTGAPAAEAAGSAVIAMAQSADQASDRDRFSWFRWLLLGVVTAAMAAIAAFALSRQGEAVEWQLVGTAKDGKALVVRPTVGDNCRTFKASIEAASKSRFAVSVKAAENCWFGVHQDMLPPPPTLTITLSEALGGRRITGEKMAALSTSPSKVRAKYVLGSTNGSLPSTTGMSAQQAAGFWARYAIPTLLKGEGTRVVDQDPAPGTALTVRDQQLVVEGTATPISVTLSLADGDATNQ